MQKINLLVIILSLGNAPVLGDKSVLNFEIGVFANIL
jgi:hypothetical protein